MKEFQGLVAVITGAASGIGRGLAERCLAEGMKVVLADIDEETLAQTEAELKGGGGDVLAVRTDVSQWSHVENLAQRTLDAFGGVHLLVNNAGVGGGATIWESTIQDWKWILGVNLWGAIHGINVFVPIMLAQETEGHIVNTSSLEGLMSGPGNGPYKVSKHGVVALSEVLFHELSLRGARIGVSVLCPGPVKTGILDSEKHRPEDLCNQPSEEVRGPEYEMWHQFYQQMIQSGLGCDVVADLVFRAIRDHEFYILTHPGMKSLAESRMRDILEGRNPTNIFQIPVSVT